MKFSNNSINVYLKCKAAYYHYKVRGITLRKKSGHLLFGELVSMGCERMVNLLSNGVEVEDAITAGCKAVEDSWIDLIGYDTPNSPQYKSMQAAQAISQQVAGLITSGVIPGEIVGAELTFKRTIAGHIYEGRVDLLMRDERGLVVYDYKTMSSFWLASYKEKLKMDRQLKGYRWLIPRSVAAYHIPCVVDKNGNVTVHDPVEQEGCHEEELELWEEETVDIITDINNSVFISTPTTLDEELIPCCWPREATACDAYGSSCDYLPLCVPGPKHAGRIDLCDPDPSVYLINGE